RPELRPVKEQKSILRWKNRGNRVAWLWILDQSIDRFALVRSKRTDIDQPRDFRVIARFRDHHSTVRMADEDDGAVLRGERALRYRHVIGQRDGRILDDRDRVPVFLEGFVDTYPAGAVDEPSVDENDVLHIPRCARLRQENLPKPEQDREDRQDAENDASPP